MKKKLFRYSIRVALFLFVIIGLGASIYQIPPKATINKFDEYPITTLLHIVPAILFLIIGLLQHSSAFRDRFTKAHRILGYVFVLSSVSIGISALCIVYVFPYSGVLEQIPITLFACLFIFFALRGVFHIINKKVQQHKNDMLRVFCLGLGASMFRLLIVPAVVIGFDPKEVVPYLFWLSFGGMLLLCEVYIKTRVIRKLKRINLTPHLKAS